MTSPIATSPKTTPKASSSMITQIGELAGRSVTVEKGSPISLPKTPEQADLRDILQEGVEDTLETLKIKQELFVSAGNKAFAAVVAQRILFWQEVQQQVEDTSNPCGTEQLQTFYNLVQEDNILLQTSTETSIPQFILNNLSKLYVNDLTKKAFLLQQLVEGNEKLHSSLEPHLNTMMEQVKKNDLKEIARCWKEMVEAVLPEAEHLEEKTGTQLQIVAMDLPILQKLFSLEKFDVDVFSLIYVRGYIRDAQLLSSFLKPDSEEHKALLPVLLQMQNYLQQGNPLGISMLWNSFLENQVVALLGQEQDEEAARVIQFSYRNAGPLKGMIDLISPGLITEDFSEEESKELMDVISKELLAITEDIAAYHPEFAKNLGNWLGSYSADNRLYTTLVEQGKQGVIQHPTKFAVWVKDLSDLIKKGFPSVPEQYSKVLNEAQRIVNLIAVKQN